MNNDQNQNPLNRAINPPSYSTPFNVDFFLNKGAGYFTKQVQQVLSLSEPVKNILTDLSTAEFVEEKLGPAFGLNAEQKAEITRIIRDILLADAFIDDFPTLISQKLGIDSGTANQIEQRVVNELFAPAIEDIKKMQREKFADRIVQSRRYQQPSQPSPAPRRSVGFVGPDETVQNGNVVDLRKNTNNR